MLNQIITIAPDQYQRMLDNYASIVEKTNTQLNLGTNPLIIAISTLTLLVAVAAIAVSIILWLNSRSIKIRVQEYIDGLEKLNKERLQKADKEFDVLIKEQQDKLASANQQTKKEIEKAIDELKKDKASIGMRLVDPAGTLRISSVYGATGPTGPSNLSSNPFAGIVVSPDIYTLPKKCGSCGHIATDFSAAFCSKCSKPLN